MLDDVDGLFVGGVDMGERWEGLRFDVLCLLGDVDGVDGVIGRGSVVARNGVYGIIGIHMFDNVLWYIG